MVKYEYKSNIPYILSLYSGYYKFQLWGAEGGCGIYRRGFQINGGKRGYISIIIFLKKQSIIWIYIGLKGTSATSSFVTSSGGYNGGGY
jgi:outer membrane protease